MKKAALVAVHQRLFSRAHRFIPGAVHRVSRILAVPLFCCHFLVEAQIIACDKACQGALVPCFCRDAGLLMVIFDKGSIDQSRQTDSQEEPRRGSVRAEGTCFYKKELLAARLKCCPERFEFSAFAENLPHSSAHHRFPFHPKHCQSQRSEMTHTANYLD